MKRGRISYHFYPEACHDEEDSHQTSCLIIETAVPAFSLFSGIGGTVTSEIQQRKLGRSPND
jgi:hypothetical protein